MIIVRTLTLEDRRKIELMWRRNASPVKIAAELGTSQCTVYKELKRGQEMNGAGDVVLDENFRPAYSAERGPDCVPEELAEPWTPPEEGNGTEGGEAGMTNFEKITASPDALGEFLASLQVATGPWDEEFHRAFCTGCEQENCDGKRCPHKAERNNPLWWLVQTVAGEPVERCYVWRNGRLNLIVPLQDEDRHSDGTCNEFNVYLNGKGPDGKVLRNIKRVIMPTVSTDENGKMEQMVMQLVFGGYEDAAEIVAFLGKKCKLEVRAAVENWSQGGQVEFYGLSYILEAVSLQIETDTVKRLAGPDNRTYGVPLHRNCRRYATVGL